MNIATIFGILFGMVILCLATWFSTDSVGVFINWPGIAIVFGGTIAATFICYPLKEVARVFGVFMTALGAEELPIGHHINFLVGLSRDVSAKGPAHLEKMVKGSENEFLRDGLQMLVDGYSKEELGEILDNRIQQFHDQEIGAADIYRTMARLAPAFGIIGTLIGLIAMMQSMAGDLAGIGPAMATALTTTLYGALFANMFFLPIATKVAKRVEERTILMCVLRDGILFLKDKTPAPIVRDKLMGYLPPRKWSSVK
ncbi:MAG: motility protein A [Desulfovibrionaceae bacterium]